MSSVLSVDAIFSEQSSSRRGAVPQAARWHKHGLGLERETC
jgi:hypothetical protein